ncbi:MAG: DHA2 family efflux MFS transporter permease subunit [Cyanobacteria bacterium P01_H01_bin.121]
MTPASDPHAAAPNPLRWWVLGGISLGVLMFTIDSSIVNVALPTFVSVFQTNFATVQWVVLSYLLVVNALTLAAARWGDLVGKKSLYIGGIILFTISSLLCGLAPSIGWLIAFRALQGAGGVMISALGAAITTEIFPRAELGIAVGMIGTMVSTGVAMGPTLGGLILHWANWHMIFFVNLPIGMIASLIIARSAPSVQRHTSTFQFDWLGAILLAAVLISFSLGMTQGQATEFEAVLPWLLLAIAAIGVALFIRLESRLEHPLLDLSLFQNICLSSRLLVTALVFLAVGGSVLLQPFFLELGLGLPPAHVGLLMLTAPLVTGMISPVAGRWVDTIGLKRMSLIGLSIMVVACLLMSTVHPDLTNFGYIWRFAPFGLGMGIFQSSNNTAVMGQAPPGRTGIVSGVLSLSRTIGQTTGIALVGTIFSLIILWSTGSTSVSQASVTAIAAGTSWGFRFVACLLFIAVFLIARFQIAPRTSLAAHRS